MGRYHKLRMKIGVQYLIAVIAILLPVASFGQAQKGSKPRSITVKEARELVYEMLKTDDWTKLPGFLIEKPYTTPEFPGVFIIDALWDNWGGGAYIGHYAVEERTGDVWMVGTCGRNTSLTLTKLQRTLRNRIGLTDLDYVRLHNPAAFCRAGDMPSVLTMGRPMWGLPKSSEKQK